MEEWHITRLEKDRELPDEKGWAGSHLLLGKTSLREEKYSLVAEQ